MTLILKSIFLLIIFSAGLISAGTESHLRPERVKNSFLFNAGRIISYTIIGSLLGLAGFIIKINGISGGVLIFIFSFVMLVITLSHISYLPKIVVMGLHSHHHPHKSFSAGLLNVFASSATLHLIMLVSLAHGYYLESGLIMLVFAIGTTYIKKPIIKNSSKIAKILQFILFIFFTLFTFNKALLYSEKYLFSPFEKNKTAVVPELLANIQYLKSGTNELDRRIIISKKYDLNWLIEGQKEHDTIYIPHFRHKSIINDNSEFLYIKAEKEGFIYYTSFLGKGDYAIKVIPNDIDVYSLDYNIVMDSGFGDDIHGESEADIEIPEIKITEPGIAEIKDGKQYVDIHITPTGYLPSVVVLKQNVPAVLNFIGDDLTESNKRIIMPSYNEYLEFSTGDNFINIPSPLIDFIFYSWKGDFGGYVLVVENLEGMTKEKAQRQIRMLNVNGI